MGASLAQYHGGALRSRRGLRRLVWTVHRWLGLASGAVVLVVALTGALYAFAPEVGALYLRRFAWVSPPAGARPLAPSALVQRAEAAVERAAGSLPAGTRRRLTLSAEPGRSAVYSVAPAGAAGGYEAYVDPYRGAVLLVRDMRWDPLGVLLRAHRSLLLPPEIGRRVVGVAVLVFVPSLLTGALLWLPRRPRTLLQRGVLRRRLTVGLRGRVAGVARDLHRVLGGYALAVTLILALTGLVWSFAWVDRVVYWLATGGQAPRERGWRSGPPGDAASAPIVTDEAVATTGRTFPDAARLDVGFPVGPADVLVVCATAEAASSHRRDCLAFDQYTGRRIGADLHRDRNAGERLRAANHDIHVGRIAGPGGRLAALLGSLAAASLPITGALVWWTRRRRP